VNTENTASSNRFSMTLQI